MSYYILTYDVVENFGERRTPHRPDHLRHVRDAHERGELAMAGAVGDPPEAALLLFDVADRSAPEDFARRDPYVINGLVKKWQVRPWHVVVGGKT